ncbi:MAG: protein kinase [Kiritimatiellia bacterium]
MSDQMPDNSSSDEAAPVIEGFRVLEKLGRGATSSVWKAEQISLNRLVVIKVLSERLTHEPEDVTLFKAEARMAANFKHAGIVQVYDFGQSKIGRRYYFVMEYISGYSVGDWIRRKGRIAEPEALVIAQAVADALKYAWDFSRIVHCDIKPDNIMVDGDGSIKVADLGLAHTVKTMSNQPGADANEVIITGTPNYMAPEQVRGLDPIDCRADIYALGASLYHMVTGQLPFGDSPPDVVMERQINETFEYPQQINPDLSTGVTRLIVQMTAKDPAARFQTWDEVLTEVVRLERQMRKQAAAATQPAPPAGASGQRPEISAQRSEVSNISAPNVPPENGLKCRSCGKPVQPQALYCGFCGKPVSVPAQQPVENRKQMTIRLKPIRPKSSANGKSAVAPPPPAPAPAPRLRRAPGRWYRSWSGNVRVVISLCLLACIGYYAYQKLKYKRDVSIPIKIAIIRNIQPVFKKSLQYAEQGFRAGSQLSYRLIWARFATNSAPALDPQAAAPKSRPAPDGIPAPAESSDSAPAVSQEETAAPASAMPEASAQSETPPAASEPPKPAPAAAHVKPPQEVEYERILQTCKQQQPKAGDRITLHFKNGHAPVEGVLEQTTAEGIRVKVSAGVIEYPFRLVTEETRSLYFPEERARRLQSQ